MTYHRVNLDLSVVPLHDADAWFKRLYDREPGLLKVIVEPGHPPGEPDLDE